MSFQTIDIHAIRSDSFKRLVDNSDSIRRDTQRSAAALERIADSFEEYVKLCANNNRS